MSNPNYFWSEDQKTRLKQSYASGGGLQEAVKVIPEKDRSTIAAQASRMGLTVPKPRKLKNTISNSGVLDGTPGGPDEGLGSGNQSCLF